MRDYYRHARDVLNSSSLVIEQCLARVRGKPPPAPRVRDVEDGLAHRRRPARDPARAPAARAIRCCLLRAFAVAQRHDVPLTRKARRLIRENLDLIDDAYPARVPAAVAVFFGILRAGAARDAHADGDERGRACSAAYLPEWEHIVSRWQHVMYHTYTVDVHSIFLVEELRRLWKGDFEKELPELTAARARRGRPACR